MSRGTAASSAANWQKMYVAALLEGDNARIPSLIVRAEQAIVERARELFKAEGDHLEEEQRLDEALYALHALKSCLAVHGGFAGTGTYTSASR